MSDKEILFQIKTLHQCILQELIKDKSESEPIPSPTQMKILDYILEHQNERIYQKDMEDMLKISRATVSDVLQTMEKNGLIERAISNDDSRVKQIILKDKAKNIFKKNYEYMKNIEKVVIKDISKEQLKEFSEILDKMIDNLKHNNQLTENKKGE